MSTRVDNRGRKSVEFGGDRNADSRCGTRAAVPVSLNPILKSSYPSHSRRIWLSQCTILCICCKLWYLHKVWFGFSNASLTEVCRILYSSQISSLCKSVSCANEFVRCVALPSGQIMNCISRKDSNVIKWIFVRSCLHLGKVKIWLSFLIGRSKNISVSSFLFYPEPDCGFSTLLFITCQPTCVQAAILL